MDAFCLVAGGIRGGVGNHLPDLGEGFNRIGSQDRDATQHVACETRGRWIIPQRCPALRWDFHASSSGVEQSGG
jgi:hypothetical protein